MCVIGLDEGSSEGMGGWARAYGPLRYGVDHCN